MTVISKPCDILNTMIGEKIKYGSYYGDKVVIFLTKVAARAGTLDNNSILIRSMRGKTNIDTQTLVFKKINTLRAQLITKLEQEKNEGKELSQEDIDMIHILENELPDLLINYCSKQRNSENMKNLTEGGYRRKTKKNRNKKSRKNRK